MNEGKTLVLMTFFLLLIFQPLFCSADSNMDPLLIEQSYLLDVWKPPQDNFVPLKIFAHMRSGNQKLNDDIEVGSLEWKDGKWQLILKIGVWGVSAFSRVRAAEWMSARDWQIQEREPNIIKESYFRNTFENLSENDLKKSLPKSFDDIPELAELIRKQLTQVESMFNTSFIRTQFQVHFINERDLVAQDLWLNPENIIPKISERIFSAQLTAKNLFLPLNYMPIPNPGIITPGSGDPYTWAQLMAHEIFHLISRIHFNDGFVFSNYPIEGIMNGGQQHRYLRDVSGGVATLLGLELNTLIASQIDFRNRTIPNATTDIYSIAENFGKPSYFTEAILTDNLKHYVDEPEEIRQQVYRYKKRKLTSCLNFYSN